MNRPIAISLAPNMENDDVFQALRMLFSPLKWKDNSVRKLFESRFATYFDKDFKAISVNSGRSAFYLILKALDISKGDEVIIQALTCVVMPNAILRSGATPIYVDIDTSYNIDPDDLKRKVTKKTKAIVIQHTFGQPAQVQAIKEIIKNTNIVLIEDCAHSLGVTYKGKKLGTLGDISFFSFGRDKIISSVFGGAIITENKDYLNKIEQLVDQIPEPSPLWTLQQLLHPICMSLILPIYNYKIGKIGLVLMQKLNIISRAIYSDERQGKQPELFPAKYPNALAQLALHQLAKIDTYSKKRSKIVNLYNKALSQEIRHNISNLPLLRYPLELDNVGRFNKFARSKNIVLGDWYRQTVVPVLDLNLVKYQKGSCPKAEKASKRLINLPTYPTMTDSDAQKVIETIKIWTHTR